MTVDLVGKIGHTNSLHRGLYLRICNIFVFNVLYSSRIPSSVMFFFKSLVPAMTTMFLYEVQARGSMSATWGTKLLKPGVA